MGANEDSRGALRGDHRLYQTRTNQRPTGRAGANWEGCVSAIGFTIDDAFLEAIAMRIAAVLVEYLGTQTGPRSPWVNVGGAATYLDTTEDAVRSAVKRRQLHPSKTATGRLLFHREELDRFATAGDG